MGSGEPKTKYLAADMTYLVVHLDVQRDVQDVMLTTNWTDKFISDWTKIPPTPFIWKRLVKGSVLTGLCVQLWQQKPKKAITHYVNYHWCSRLFFLAFSGARTRSCGKFSPQACCNVLLQSRFCKNVSQWGHLRDVRMCHSESCVAGSKSHQESKVPLI